MTADEHVHRSSWFLHWILHITLIFPGKSTGGKKRKLIIASEIWPGSQKQTVKLEISELKPVLNLLIVRLHLRRKPFLPSQKRCGLHGQKKKKSYLRRKRSPPTHTHLSMDLQTLLCLMINSSVTHEWVYVCNDRPVAICTKKNLYFLELLFRK